MEFKKYHRKYPQNSWNYKAISTVINGVEIIYYTLIDRKRKYKGIEIYYRNRSRTYSLSKIPIKYEEVVRLLKRKHESTKWSSAKEVNSN